MLTGGSLAFFSLRAVKEDGNLIDRNLNYQGSILGSENEILINTAYREGYLSLSAEDRGRYRLNLRQHSPHPDQAH